MPFEHLQDRLRRRWAPTYRRSRPQPGVVGARHDRLPNEEWGSIWATGPRGRRHWRLAKRGPGDSGSNSPDWSPSGDKLVFRARVARSSNKGDGPAEGLFVVNRDGTELRRIRGPERRNHYAYISQPVWSPNGRWIAYMADDSIYKIHPIGGRAKLMMKDPWWEPDWCPRRDMEHASIYTSSPAWQPLPAKP